MRPTSYEQFNANKDQMTYTKCFNCGEPFDDGNTYTQLGWIETQISGICECCFDSLFEPEEEEDEE